MAKLLKRVVNFIQHTRVGFRPYSNSNYYGPSPNSNSPIEILSYRSVYEPKRIERNILSFLRYPPLDFPSDVIIDFPFFKSADYLSIRGHSHGIVCIAYLHDVYLCNPATRECRLLPPSLLLTDSSAHYLQFSCSQTTIGFGYDSKSNDFKVVRILKYWEVDSIYPYRAEVYNLSTDQWREIQTPVSSYVDFHAIYDFHHEGICYWRCKKLKVKEFILSFDMSEEVFHTIPLPEGLNIYDDDDDDDDDVDEVEGTFRNFGVWNGSVVLFHYPLDPWEGPEVKTIQVWGMQKDECVADEVLWSKLLTIGPFSTIYSPLLFVNSNELLMDTNDGRLFSYNLNTQEFKYFPLKGEGKTNQFQAFIFEPTPLSVKPGTRLHLGLGAASASASQS